MAIVRTYLCGECGTKFDKLHWDKNEPAPECPGCQALAARQIPAGFMIGGNAAKAGDLAGRILEEDYGIAPSQVNDRMREGDIAVKIPAHLQKQADNFFAPNAVPVAPGKLIQAAKATAAQNAAEGRNPLTMLQKGRKASGQTRVPVVQVNHKT